MQNKTDVLSLPEPIGQIASKLAKTLGVDQLEFIGYRAMGLILNHYKPANSDKQEYYNSFNLCPNELFFRISQPLTPKQLNNPCLVRKNAHKYQVSDCPANYTVVLFDCDLKEIYGFWSHNIHLSLLFSSDYTDICASIKGTQAEKRHLLTRNLFPVKTIDLATFEKNPLYIFRFYEALIRKFKFSRSLMDTISNVSLKEETFNRWKDALANKFHHEQLRYGEIYRNNLNDVKLMKKIAEYHHVYLELKLNPPPPNPDLQLNSVFELPLSSPETLPTQVDENLAPEPMIEIIEISENDARHIPEPEPVVEEPISQKTMTYRRKPLPRPLSWNFLEPENQLELNETLWNISELDENNPEETGERLDFSELDAFPDNDITFQQESATTLFKRTEALYKPTPTIEALPTIIPDTTFSSFENEAIFFASSQANQEFVISPNLIFSEQNLSYETEIPPSEKPEKILSSVAKGPKPEELFDDFLTRLEDCPATKFLNYLFTSLPNCKRQTDKIMAYLQPVIRYMRTDFNFFLRAMGAVIHKENRFKVLLLGLIIEDPSLATKVDSSLDTMVSRALEGKFKNAVSYSYDFDSLKLILKNIETIIEQLPFSYSKTLIQILIKNCLQPPMHILKTNKSDNPKPKPSKRKRASAQEDEEEYIDDKDEYIDSVSTTKRRVKQADKSTEKQTIVHQAIIIEKDTKAVNKKLLKRKRNLHLVWWQQDKETAVNKHADSVSHKKRQIELADGTTAKQNIVKAIAIEEPKEVDPINEENSLVTYNICNKPPEYQQPVIHPEYARGPSNHIQLSMFYQKPTTPVSTVDKTSEFFYKPPH